MTRRIPTSDAATERTLSVRVPGDLLDAFTAAAATEERTVSAELRLLIRRRVESGSGENEQIKTALPRDLAEQTLAGTLPYEETWRENAINVLALLNELERLRGERFDTSDVKTRDLGRIAVEGLTVMRDEDDDDDSWELPDLRTINRAIQAVTALVKRAEDRQRFKRALTRIGKEWTDGNATPDAVRAFAREVLAGGSARVPLAAELPPEPEERELSYDDQLRLDTTVLPGDGPLVVKLKQIMGERVASPEEPTA